MKAALNNKQATLVSQYRDADHLLPHPGNTEALNYILALKLISCGWFPSMYIIVAW